MLSKLMDSFQEMTFNNYHVRLLHAVFLFFTFDVSLDEKEGDRSEASISDFCCFYVDDIG